jgi:predicted phage tail protein
LERRGNAFGLFNLVNGLLLLVASIVAGVLWDHIGPVATFYAGGSFAVLGVVGLLLQVGTASETNGPTTTL